MPLGVDYVRETTIFREYGPLSGDTMSLGYEDRAELRQPAVAPDVRRRCALLPAARHQRRAGVPRPRLQELGRLPRLHLLRRKLGTARLRLPGVPRQQGLLHQRRAPLPGHRSRADPDWGVGGLRGVLFEPGRRAGYEGAPIRSRRTSRQPWRRCSATLRPTSPSLAAPVRRPRPSQGSGCRMARASYGIGLETFALGFPIHFDWSWRTLFNKDWEDYLYSYQGASDRHDRQPVAPQGEVQRLDRVRLLKNGRASACQLPASRRVRRAGIGAV